MVIFFRRLLTVAIGLTTVTVAAAPITVEDILHTVKQPEVLTADYTLEKKSPSVAVTLTSRGRLVVSKTQGILWFTAEPFEDCQGFSAAKRGELDDAGHWVTAPAAYAGQAVDITQKLLTAGPEELRNHFFLTPSGTPEAWQLLASPKGGTLANFLTEVLFKGGTHLQSVQMAQTNGTLTRIYFSRVETNPPLRSDDLKRLESLQ